ncbi:DNA/RNA non-specific endonuclease, partial [Gemmatimonadota bacterium]
ELWQFHDHAFVPGTTVRADLVGNEHLRWGYPGGECVVLINDYFITCHDNAYRVPQWVSYHLTAENVTGAVERTDDFRPDPRLPEGRRAELKDYEGSGYDRGHMAPAAAFRRSEAAMSRTFLLSNMSPQTPSLNRLMWRMLEEDVRELASKSANIWVFTGSLFLDENGSLIEPTFFIGENGVAVPTHFYKVVLAEFRAPPASAASRANLFAFVMPNQPAPLAGEPSDYLVTVDLVEALSGLDFFSVLPDSLEDRLEEEVATTWPIGKGTNQ